MRARISNQVGTIVVGLILGLASSIGIGYIGVIPNLQLYDLQLQLEGVNDETSTLQKNVDSLEQDITSKQAEISDLDN